MYGLSKGKKLTCGVVRSIENVRFGCDDLHLLRRLVGPLQFI
jgi:hypothetical protein